MVLGPVFAREAYVAPRQGRHYAYRAVYVSALLLLMCTAWLVVAGTQIIRNVGDMARFGAILFQILAPLQLALVVFIAALRGAGGVAQEKDRRTLILLLMTRMSNFELVAGKLLASLLNVLVMLLAALPLFMMIVLFGGVSFGQTGRTFLVTLVTALAAGSLGSTLALWREKTFQTLALTALVLLFWLGIGEAIAAGFVGDAIGGIAAEKIAIAVSPLRGVLAAARPEFGLADNWIPTGPVAANLLVSLVVMCLLNGIAVARVRVWNPSRELRPRQATQESIWGAEHDLAQAGPATRSDTDREDRAEHARSGHVDARQRKPSDQSRRVWDNPILWREICTWAYGRKVLVIRLAYLLLFFMAGFALYTFIADSPVFYDEGATSVPDAAKPLAPFCLVSLVIINALAVNSITNERDGQSLDLLLVTDLSPKEFIFGKLGGVLWATKEMVLLPMLLCAYMWWRGALYTENFVFVLSGLAVLDLFVAMLGLHFGMIYANSRSAIGVSLGTVFFLFLGVITCMLMMISFSDDTFSFHKQLAPFLACILGGGVGLFVALGARNPSAAIGTASLLLPFATFYAITSFLMNQPTSVFIVTLATYGFATAAMLVPAIYEFDIAMGRTKAAGGE